MYDDVLSRFDTVIPEPEHDRQTYGQNCYIDIDKKSRYST